MPDPKLEGAPIVRATLCVVGAHSFVRLYNEEDFTFCSCGAYDYESWKKEMETQAAKKKEE